MIEEIVNLKTRDGQMETFICRPERGASHPVVFLLMDAPPEKENIASYIRISKHLALLGLKAPAVFQRDLENGFLIEMWM